LIFRLAATAFVLEEACDVLSVSLRNIGLSWSGQKFSHSALCVWQTHA